MPTYTKMWKLNSWKGPVKIKESPDLINRIRYNFFCTLKYAAEFRLNGIKHAANYIFCRIHPVFNIRFNTIKAIRHCGFYIIPNFRKRIFYCIQNICDCVLYNINRIRNYGLDSVPYICSSIFNFIKNLFCFFP